MEFTGRQIRGKSVIDNRGNNFGEVHDVALDPDQWRVTGLVVKVKKEVADDLRIDRPMFGDAELVVGADRVAQFGDHVVLNIGLPEIGGLLRQP